MAGLVPAIFVFMAEMPETPAGMTRKGERYAAAFRSAAGVTPNTSR
jgi:hypothetical protein